MNGKQQQWEDKQTAKSTPLRELFAAYRRRITHREDDGLYDEQDDDYNDDDADCFCD